LRSHYLTRSRRHLSDALILAQPGPGQGVFDDDRLVADAGLILPATLAARLGLRNSSTGTSIWVSGRAANVAAKR